MPIDSFTRRFCIRFINTYWRVVRRFNPIAYYRHEIELDPDFKQTLKEGWMYFETKNWMLRALRVHVGISDTFTRQYRESLEDGTGRIKMSH